MKKLSATLFALTVLTLSACQTSSLSETEKAPAPKSDTEFSGQVRGIDKSKSVISFVGKSSVVNHEGKFNEYGAALTLDAENPADLEKAKITAEISIASVKTDAKGLDGHLQSEEFFDTTKHPKATFSSTSIVGTAGNWYEITGDLTIKGTTKSIVFTAEITDSALTAHYELLRKDFGIGKDTYGSKLLEPNVPVDIKLVFMK